MTTAGGAHPDGLHNKRRSSYVDLSCGGGGGGGTGFRFADNDDDDDDVYL